MVLTGAVEKRIDNKGRLSIPKKMRLGITVVDNQDVIILKLDGCLQVYALDDWREVQSRIEKLSPFQQQTRKLQRMWGMNADHLSMDSEGRLTLTRDQKDYSGIDRDVVVVGAINKVEIWSKARWREMMLDSPSLEELADEIDIQK